VRMRRKSCAIYSSEAKHACTPVLALGDERNCVWGLHHRVWIIALVYCNEVVGVVWFREGNRPRSGSQECVVIDGACECTAGAL
jgi:hypothetical protein